MSRVSGGWDAHELILSAPNLYSGKPKCLVTVLFDTEQRDRSQREKTRKKASVVWLYDTI